MSALAWLAFLGACSGLLAQNAPDGFIVNQGRTLFPIGCYTMPKDDAELRAMAEAGFNLIHCADVAELDRAQRAGMMGWISVPLQLGPDHENVRKAVEAAKDHPALAVWEGPDEVVWHFTAYSGLHRSGVYKQSDEWWQQTPFAVERSEAEAKKILTPLRAAAQMIRRTDRRRLPIWINEASRSDMKFIREYIDDIDITGCDIYPINKTATDSQHLPGVVGYYTQRFLRIGRGKPVWMVLQAFSWHSLSPNERQLIYPTFAESRLMAYAAIANGAKGVLYWGSVTLPKDTPFRQSLSALASELHALQPFLTAPEQSGARLLLTDSLTSKELAGPRSFLRDSSGRPVENSQGVRLVVRQAAGEWLVVLVNEDNHHHTGVEVSGLTALQGQTLTELYGAETVTLTHGDFVTRLKPYEVKVFASSRKWETPRRAGRDFR